MGKMRRCPECNEDKDWDDCRSSRRDGTAICSECEYELREEERMRQRMEENLALLRREAMGPPISPEEMGSILKRLQVLRKLASRCPRSEDAAP